MSGAPVRWLDRILPALTAAVALPEPDRALAAVLGLLGQHGATSRSTADADPWICLEREGRRIALAHPSEPTDAQTRDVAIHLLDIALARVAAHDQYRTVCERAEMLSSASFEGIMVHVDGVIIDANQRLCEMLGYERAEVLGPNTLARCCAPEDLPGVLERMRDRFEGAYVITGVRKDGSRFRAELQSKQGRLGDRPVRVVAVRDVTERERANAMLRESEARLRELAEVAFDVIAISRNGIILEMGGDPRKLWDQDPAVMKGRPIMDFIAVGSRELTRRMVTEERSGIFDAEVLGVDGQPIPVQAMGVNTTWRGESARIAGLRDLREQRRLETERADLIKQVERAQRMESLGVLAGGIAHDFNNLLVGVLGNAELLLDRVTDPGDRQAVQAILAAGERAAALTAQMLAYAGKRDLARREPVDLGKLCHELHALLDAALSKKAQVTFSIEPGSVVMGDRATLTQVLMNLLTNASDALQDRPGTIQVLTRRIVRPDARFDGALAAAPAAGDWILTEVCDSGVGMDQATMTRVFEPFFSTKATGHGLGLAACLGIVSAHGGAIVVESEPGKGTRFSMVLPATKQAVETPEAPAKPSVVRSRRVLIVDDEALVRQSTRRLLQRQGYDVTEASDGLSALSALEQGDIDVVLLDMTMPDIDGGEVVRRVRARGWAVPIVLSTGFIEPSVERTLDR
ncbi:MAG TPA: PAS domain S-box protein, partial [Polyangia bacterium]|nr:PAS domain S-box protein [Polyangia bacterium]